jgi:hypothetical protein
MAEGGVADVVRVLARYLTFRCPHTRDVLVSALTGVSGAAPILPGFSVVTLTGAPLLPYVPVSPATTFADVAAALAAQHASFAQDCTLLMYRGARDGPLLRVPLRAPPSQLLQETTTLVAVHITPHTLQTTTITDPLSWFGDIACPRCGGRGPGRHTGHLRCAKCQCCGTCCVQVEPCGVDPAVSTEDYCKQDDEVDAARKAASAEQYLSDFYVWQEKQLRSQLPQ